MSTDSDARTKQSAMHGPKFDYSAHIPLEECADARLLSEIVSVLWSILDNIDTLDDACRSNDDAYRRCVRAEQAKRWGRTPITTDGYRMFVSRSALGDSRGRNTQDPSS